MAQGKPSRQERRPPARAAEVAAFLRIKPHTLENWRSRGYGPPWRPGRPVLYDWDEVEAWWDAHRNGPSSRQGSAHDRPASSAAGTATGTAA